MLTRDPGEHISTSSSDQRLLPRANNFWSLKVMSHGNLHGVGSTLGLAEDNERFRFAVAPARPTDLRHADTVTCVGGATYAYIATKVEDNQVIHLALIGLVVAAYGCGPVGIAWTGKHGR